MEVFPRHLSRRGGNERGRKIADFVLRGEKEEEGEGGGEGEE